MPQVKLDILDANEAYIGSLDIEDHRTFPLAISHSLSDLRDITKRSGIISKTFKVPATKNNNKLLNYIYNANVEPGDVLFGRKAVVRVDGLPVIQGNIRVKSSRQRHNPAEYELELKGDSLEWVERFKDASIRDLEFGNPSAPVAPVDPDTGLVFPSIIDATERFHPFGQAYIEASWDGSYDTGWDYVYSLKGYGTWKGSNVVSLDDMRPDLYVYAILKRSFDAIGYTFTSDFFESDFGKRLILPFTTGAFLHGEETIKLFSTKASSTANNKMLISNPGSAFVDSIPLTFDNTIDDPSGALTNGNVQYILGLQGTSSGDATIFTGSTKGKYVFSLSGEVTGFLGAFASIGIFRQPQYSTAAYEFLGYLDFPTSGNSTSVELELEEGDKAILALVNYADPLTLLSGAELTVTLQSEILQGSKYDVAKVFPDLSQLDMVSGLINMFNLYFQTDTVLRTVRCEPRDNFYQSTQHALDWSQKLDLSVPIETEFVNNYKRTLNFRFKDDGKDSWADAWKEQNNEIPGSLEHNLPVRFKAGKVELGTKQFAYTFMYEDQAVFCPGKGKVWVPRLWNGDGEPPDPSYDFRPRILYYEGNVPATDSSGVAIGWQWLSDTICKDRYPRATLGHDGNKRLDYAGDDGLVANFYQNDIATLEDGKIIIALFYLTATDILQLDLSRPIYINHHNLKGYYYINKLVDYQPTKIQSTKVELIRVFETPEAIIDFGNGIDANNARLAPGLGEGGGLPPGTGGGNAEKRAPSTVLNNGSGNAAGKNSGSIAFGQGVIAAGTDQSVYGAYNNANTEDIWQVGTGTAKNDRYTGLTFTSDGTFLIQGGEMYTRDGQQVLFGSQRDDDGNAARFDKVLLLGPNVEGD